MNDPLEKLLHDDARMPLEDDGFAARVMRALPPAQARIRPWLRPALVMGSATVGSLLAVTLSPQGAMLFAGFEDIAHLRAATPGAIASLAICGALLVSAVVLAFEE